jgi:RimJ/RimL family protein N-acetyltransferase
MEPLLSDRLCLRPYRADDLDVLFEIRNDPSTAEFQSWTLPYPLEKVETLVSKLAAMQGPTDDEWFGLVITEAGSEVMLGDVVVRLGWQGRTAEIGYNLHHDARRNGYATEATARTIEWLFNDLGVQRIHASLHPDNVASMMVLERLGFIYEGTQRQAYWVGDECSDDPIFGLLRADWESWNSRPRHRPTSVELVEITPENRHAVFDLATHRSQERFVSPMHRSAVDALIPEDDDEGGTIVPWFRAIVADGSIVGFVMVAEPTPTHRQPYLWRLLIGRADQRRGIGWKVLDLISERYRAMGHTRLTVSWEPGRGGPEPMYLRYGFIPTGEVDDGEIVGSLSLELPEV